MYRHLVVTAIILSMLTSSLNCTRQASRDVGRLGRNISGAEACHKPVKNILVVQLAEGIIGVVLKTWEVVQFDSLGGHYSVETDLLFGTTIAGAHFEVRPDDAREILFAGDPRVIFDENRGEVDSLTHVIHGTDVGGTGREIPLSEVLALTYMEDAPGRFLLLFGLSVAIVVGYFALYEWLWENTQ